MKHELVFGIPIYRYHLDPTEIKRVALEKINQYKSYPINETPSGWDCDVRTDFNMGWNNCDMYAPYYKDIMKQFSDDVGLRNAKANIYEIWLNFYNKGQNQEEHDHIPGFFSACHYIKYDPEIHSPTRWRSPLIGKFLYQYSDLMSEEDIDPEKKHPEYFQPDLKEGDIIIFPCWLRHSVKAQKTNDLRITMAFNINTIKGSTRRVFSPS